MTSLSLLDATAILRPTRVTKEAHVCLINCVSSVIVAQKEALRIATGCHKMSHTDHLRVETKLLPVKQNSELLAKQYWHALSSNSSSALKTKLKKS